jgi:hypothetical protein
MARRVNPRHVAFLRVDPTTPHHHMITVAPHQAAPNSPYVHHVMAGENLFDTFEEEHMDTPSLPWYNTMARVQQHSANIVQHYAPRVFHPITFINIQGYHIYPQRAINPMANAVINLDMGASLEYHQLMHAEATFSIWNKAAANEFGILAQGVGGRIEVSITILFILCQAIPKGKVVTYVHFEVDIHPYKSELHRVRLTMGGSLIQYPGGVSACSADLTTSKYLLNITISTDGAKYMCLYVNNSYM